MDPFARLRPYAARAEAPLLAALADLAPPRLRDASEHYPRAGGKRLRPALALVAAEAAGAPSEDAIPFAVAVELVHDFSLVHDDIMDHDALRRGLPTVHVKWDEATAILAGDALLAKAFEAVAVGAKDATRARDGLLVLAHATRVLCEGQALDMEFETRETDEAEYVRMIDAKTAALFSAACEGGALVAGASREHARAAGRFGRAFGLAFQLADDLLDYTATTAALGKPAGSDLRAGKRSIVALAAFQRGVPEFQAVFGKKDADERDLQRVVDALAKSGVIADVEARVRRETAAAHGALAELAASPAATLLGDLAEWAATRKS
ncbi:MAG: polyprenyl synthetase family protein [Thermoplasmatota archaeon]